MTATAALQSLCCQGCGAPLSVGKGARIVTCGYCARQAKIAADDGASSEVTAKLDHLKLREDLRDLDAAWEKYRTSVSDRDKQGEYHPPSAGNAFGYLVIGAIATLGASIILGSQASPWSILVVAPIGIWITRHLWSAELERVNAFNSMRVRYAARRAELVRRIGIGVRN